MRGVEDNQDRRNVVKGTEYMVFIEARRTVAMLKRTCQVEIKG